VEAYDGRIWAKRRPEGGSEFGFALPVDDDSLG
jgi:signal transduction histidine kinase